MGFFKRLIAIAIVIGAILLFLDSRERGTRPHPKPPAAAATPTPIPPPATPIPRPVAQAPVAPQPPTAQLQQAAQDVRATVVSLQPDNGWWLVTITAQERNSLGDFLDAAIRRGMKDVDVNYPNNYTQTTRNGRPMVSQTFRLRF